MTIAQVLNVSIESKTGPLEYLGRKAAPRPSRSMSLAFSFNFSAVRFSVRVFFSPATLRIARSKIFNVYYAHSRKKHQQNMCNSPLKNLTKSGLAYETFLLSLCSSLYMLMKVILFQHQPTDISIFIQSKGAVLTCSNSYLECMGKDI